MVLFFNFFSFFFFEQIVLTLWLISLILTLNYKRRDFQFFSLKKMKKSIPINSSVFHTACILISGTKSTQNLNIFYSVIYSRPFRLIFDNCIHLKFVLRASKYLFPIYLTSIFCYCSHKMSDSIATRERQWTQMLLLFFVLLFNNTIKLSYVYTFIWNLSHLNLSVFSHLHFQIKQYQSHVATQLNWNVRSMLKNVGIYIQ